MLGKIRSTLSYRKSLETNMDPLRNYVLTIAIRFDTNWHFESHSNNRYKKKIQYLVRSR